ncbi:unnamed protein product [Pseudo-nitzschia multistriata]|uniref:G-protein coupled receptors family 3 profile domain-containing protein n=1 Tax=Pseudo-nitzschia multistriata TaxID=183589 RepID=A0A448ZMC0_9STRA|nr:unnamed protein product [Pseudo-nitzschia multistriata]
MMAASRLLIGLWGASFGVNLFATLGSLVFINCFRSKPIIAMGQPTMLSVLCLGALLHIAATICWVLPGSMCIVDLEPKTMDVLCEIDDWLYFLGSIVIFTVLLCKLYRVHKLTQFRRHRPILASHLLFGPFAVVLSLAVALMAASQILYPTDHSVISIEDVNATTIGGIACQTTDTQTIEFCPVFDGGLWSGHFYFQCVKNIILFLIQIGILVFAWKLRTFNEELGDAKHVMWLIISQKIVGIVCLGLVLWANSEIKEFRYEVYLVGVVAFTVWKFYYVFSTIAFMVFPRIYLVCYELVRGKLPDSVQLYGAGQVHVVVDSDDKQNVTQP